MLIRPFILRAPYPLVLHCTSSRALSSASTQSSSGTVCPTWRYDCISRVSSESGNCSITLRIASPTERRRQPYSVTKRFAAEVEQKEKMVSVYDTWVVVEGWWVHRYVAMHEPFHFFSMGPYTSLKPMRRDVHISSYTMFWFLHLGSNRPERSWVYAWNLIQCTNTVSIKMVRTLNSLICYIEILHPQYSPVDFPDFGGPTMASLTGTAGPVASCAR